MQDFLSTVTWVAPLILTIIFSGVIPLLVHWHRISRNPTVKVSAHKTGRNLNEYALSVSFMLDGSEDGKNSIWYRACLKNMDNGPIVLRKIEANHRTVCLDGYDYVMPGEEVLISFSQDLTKKEARVVLDTFDMVIQNKDARFKVTVKVDNTDVFPKYKILKIKYLLF